MSANAKHLILAMIVLPGTVVVVIPGVLLWLYGFEPPQVGDLRFWLAKPLLPAGIVIAGWTVANFWVDGRGTPAPWHPPKRLVVTGAYRYVRNPMLIAVMMFLMGEALLFNSAPIAVWLAVFFALNNVYFIFKEEPALERRFGADYLLYKAHVRRWVPRFSPWTPPWSQDQAPCIEEAEEEDPWAGYTPSEKRDEDSPPS